MKNKIKALLLVTIISMGLCMGTNAAVKKTKAPVKPHTTIQKTLPAKKAASKTPAIVYEPTSSLAIVANPAKYLNKHVKIKATFDKFSTLGLDYKPAFKSSEKYITFLIKRDDVANHTIPLSEMKNFLERSEAEKYIDLAEGDEIEYSGTVFSDALGDAWVNVEKFTVLSQKSKTKTPVKK